MSRNVMRLMFSNSVSVFNAPHSAKLEFVSSTGPFGMGSAIKRRVKRRQSSTFHNTCFTVLGVLGFCGIWSDFTAFTRMRNDAFRQIIP